MITSRKKILALASMLTLTVALFLSGCNLPASLGGEPSNDTSSRTQVQQTVQDSALVNAGTLTVGVNLDAAMAPLCYEQDGDARGLDADLASALAGQMGLKVKFVNVSSPASSLGTVCDVVMGQRASTEGVYTLAGTYAESASAFFHKGDTGIAKVDDLSSKRLGLQGGSVSEAALDRTGLTVEKKGYGKVNDAFAALESGDVDYVLCEAYAGAYLAHSAYEDVRFVGTLNRPEAEGIACSNSNTELSSAVSSALDTLKGNGVYSLIRSRWLGDFDSIEAETDQVKNIPTKQEGTAGATTTGSSTAGTAAGSNAAGSNAAGSNAAGSNAAGAATTDSTAAGSNAAGSNAAGSNAAGSNAAGSNAAGTTTTGSNAAGT